MKIQSAHSWPILDSRGNWTIAVELTLSGGAKAQAQVPAGASTGRHEAVALPAAQAAANVNVEIAQALTGRDADLPTTDRFLIALDGTHDKSRLGANALLGVSCALARALSIAAQQPLWRTLRDIYQPSRPATLPRPMINILSGGLHAGANIEFQDFLIIPNTATTMHDVLQTTVDIHRAVGRTLRAQGYVLTGVADEGGWGPLLPSNEAAMDVLSSQLEGRADIAIDVASSHFYENGQYHLKREGASRTAEGMTDLLASWTERYPLVSAEDALAEDDWQGWQTLTARLKDKLQLVGDDFFTTNLTRVKKGIETGCANAVLVKMNQIGTLTETFEVLEAAHAAGYRCVVSARSGETEDSFLADLATASGAGQIKIGSITRSERLAKYNRLLELERSGDLALAGPVYGR
ncbi:enolase [Bryobacterales bacterium F-183]|nr:enolase [Bryobacterales bacterium F-183]